jgi:hypothetical protein
MAALANLLAPRGVLVVCGHCGEKPAAEVEGPPWPVTAEDARRLAVAAGLREQSMTIDRGRGRLRMVCVRS